MLEAVLSKMQQKHIGGNPIWSSANHGPINHGLATPRYRQNDNE